jgi:hypothetical protein
MIIVVSTIVDRDGSRGGGHTSQSCDVGGAGIDWAFGLLVEMVRAADVSFTPMLPTPVVCSATDSFLSDLLALVVVEAGTSCRSSVVALEWL